MRGIDVVSIHKYVFWIGRHKVLVFPAKKKAVWCKTPIRLVSPNKNKTHPRARGRGRRTKAATQIE
jgi:hypothetical protein